MTGDLVFVVGCGIGSWSSLVIWLTVFLSCWWLWCYVWWAVVVMIVVVWL